MKCASFRRFSTAAGASQYGGGKDILDYRLSLK